jgi:nucleoid-associated protein YgaU
MAELQKTNLYSNGRVIQFKDSRQVLLRDKIVYQEGAQDEYHTVIETDTLSDLAYKKYGNSADWYIIADVNNIHFPWELVVGSSLIIPNKDLINIKK